jgi:hypothetical protein
VPLSLQLLLENAVNIMCDKLKDLCKLDLYREWFLVIQNDYQKEVLQDRQGVGLKI